MHSLRGNQSGKRPEAYVLLAEISDEGIEADEPVVSPTVGAVAVITSCVGYVGPSDNNVHYLASSKNAVVTVTYDGPIRDYSFEFQPNYSEWAVNRDSIYSAERHDDGLTHAGLSLGGLRGLLLLRDQDLQEWVDKDRNIVKSPTEEPVFAMYTLMAMKSLGLELPNIGAGLMTSWVGYQRAEGPTDDVTQVGVTGRIQRYIDMLTRTDADQVEIGNAKAHLRLAQELVLELLDDPGQQVEWPTDNYANGLRKACSNS